MKIEALMSKSLAACSPNESLATATRIMWDRDIGFLPVVDDEGRPVGTITDRDVAMGAFISSRPLSDLPVGAVMAINVACCSATDEVSHAEQMMQELQVRRLPVVSSDGRLVGVVSINDLSRACVDPKFGNGVPAAEVAATLAVISAPRELHPAGGDRQSAELRG